MFTTSADDSNGEYNIYVLTPRIHINMKPQAYTTESLSYVRLVCYLLHIFKAVRGMSELYSLLTTVQIDWDVHIYNYSAEWLNNCSVQGLECAHLLLQSGENMIYPFITTVWEEWDAHIYYYSLGWLRCAHLQLQSGVTRMYTIITMV